MRDVVIRYNPYKVETNITIDAKAPRKNSALHVGGKRLQEWVESLPGILREECNSKEFRVEFHGTVLDYEDLCAVAETAGRETRGTERVHMECSHVPAKEVADKEIAIREVFAEIQKGPFDELREPDLLRSFELACTSEFPVNVIATMSAGKSTLINALLRRKLMPSSQEACTDKITEITDNSQEPYRAAAYQTTDAEPVAVYEDLTLEDMSELNNNPEISTIKVDGDIPFVSSDDVSLVLVDTPGTNNSRNPAHRASTYRVLKESSKTVVLYVLNATALGVNDDNDLLNYVADSMRVGGKQSKDRFLFVVNKLDEFRQGEDSVDKSLEKVRSYLEDKGILDANIFPASALTALNIRTLLQQAEEPDEDDDAVYFAIGKVRKLNRNEEYHFEKYAPLPASVRAQIEEQLEKAREKRDRFEEALIHTGIVSVESAIRLYVDKYAKTAKIKNLVDTFAQKLESAGSMERTKQEIASHRELQNEIRAQIEEIETKLADGDEARNFRDEIDNLNLNEETQKIAREVTQKAQNRISGELEEDDKLTVEEANLLIEGLKKYAEELQAKTMVDLEQMISDRVEASAQALLVRYQQRLQTLVEDLQVGTLDISPLKLMDGDITVAGDLVEKSTRAEEVVVGHRRVQNESFRWWNPFSWGDRYRYEDVTEEQEYVSSSELRQEFFAPIQKQIRENSRAATKYAEDQVKQIKKAFQKKFKELDKVLMKKLEELKLYTSESEAVREELEKTEQRLRWLEDIQQRVNAILEI